jgi:3',5'-cyclic AMP phosphodiesterase CpdA
MRLKCFCLLLAILATGLISESQDRFRFAIVGDTGTGGSGEYQVAEKLTESVKEFPFGLVLMLGDNIYGGETPSDFRKKFEKPYQGLLAAGVKFYATLGNHDEPPRQIDYKPFNMGGKRYYSFKPKADIRFFSLDSNYMDPEQLEWLERELKASGSDWKIVFFHHPIYSSGEKHGSNLELRKVLEPVMIRNGVDVVLAGHEHFYERIKPQKGINYFIIGSSAKLREGNIAKSDLTSKGFDADNVFMLADIVGDNMTFRVITRKGTVVDSGTVRRAERTRKQGSGLSSELSPK